MVCFKPRFSYILVIATAFEAVVSSIGVEPLMVGSDSRTEMDFNELKKVADKLNSEILNAHVVQMADGTVFEEDESMFHPVDMPTDFKSYDVINVDGYITLEELADVTGARENIQLAFNASDKDGRILNQFTVNKCNF